MCLGDAKRHSYFGINAYAIAITLMYGFCQAEKNTDVKFAEKRKVISSV